MICGVDVSQAVLDVQVEQGGAAASFANTRKGILQLLDFCRSHQVDLVAMEASGGYEKAAWLLLSAEKMLVAIVNPRAVRRFAQAMGYLEKTDQIDAGVIAHYARTRNSQPSAVGTELQQHLRAMVTRLRQLTEVRAAQRNQLRMVTDRTIQKMSRQLLTLMDKQILSLEEEIAKLVQADPVWSKLDQSFRTIKGVAARTVCRLLAELPEIGSLSHKRIAKLVGLAPLACDSGTMRGKRAIAGGRRSIRDILFFVAGGVARFHPDFKAFRERLTAAGKAKKVIRVALAHKLLTRLNAKAREVRQNFPATVPSTVRSA
jgi:transposase